MFLILYSHNIYIQSNLADKEEIVIGIIDGSLSKPHNNVKNITYSNDTCEKKHGDMLLDFIEKYDKHTKVAYYNAEKNGKISSKSIIDGLNWMLDNNISCICISLSSSYYSNELQDWLHQNASVVKVYASYNNTPNTFDYPAQYTDVIGVGSNPEIAYKNVDIKYRSSKVIIINHGIFFFDGNSYLAPLQLINDIRRPS